MHDYETRICGKIADKLSTVFTEMQIGGHGPPFLVCASDVLHSSRRPERFRAPLLDEINRIVIDRGLGFRVDFKPGRFEDGGGFVLEPETKKGSQHENE
jgi:hypothetical protein